MKSSNRIPSVSAVLNDGKCKCLRYQKNGTGIQQFFCGIIFFMATINLFLPEICFESRLCHAFPLVGRGNRHQQGKELTRNKKKCVIPKETNMHDCLDEILNELHMHEIGMNSKKEAESRDVLGKSNKPISSNTDSPSMTLDIQSALELDESVKFLEKGLSYEDLIQDIEIIAESTKPTKQVDSAVTEDFSKQQTAPTSQTDFRKLAISIACSIDTVEQWQQWCRQTQNLKCAESNNQENIGIYPLLQSIRDGALVFKRPPGDNNGVSFSLACNSCRAIRDLCALSPELAAVLTDCILRANVSWEGKLLSDDLASLLKIGKGHPAALYTSQLILAMVLASDTAIHMIRETPALMEAIISCSSYPELETAASKRTFDKRFFNNLMNKGKKTSPSAYEQFSKDNESITNKQLEENANQILAAVGYNIWIPKNPGQQGLRILAIDGGGSRGMTAISGIHEMLQYLGNREAYNTFDLIVGTSTGAIIAVLLGMIRESSTDTIARYQDYLQKIFRTATPTLKKILTMSTYEEEDFMKIMKDVVQDDIMLDSRADPTNPMVCCVASKMSSTPATIALFRNYNYPNNTLVDSFTVNPEIARRDLGLPLESEQEVIRNGKIKIARLEESEDTQPGTSRYSGSFRVLQRLGVRASTAAPTVFKPIMMGEEMYADGGIGASNPAAIAVHEARAIYPGIPIECVVSFGTGLFGKRRSDLRVGWDGLLGRIVDVAVDAEQVHYALEDTLGNPSVMDCRDPSKPRYFRFNPKLIGTPDDYPLDGTDPNMLGKLKQTAHDYMQEDSQRKKLDQIAAILEGKKAQRKSMWSTLFSRFVKTK